MMPEEILRDLALVSACVGGAATIADTEAFLRDAGFADIRITPSERGKELLMQWDPEKAEVIGRLLTSATIEAVKP